MFIPFNKPTLSGKEEKYILDSISSRNLAGDGQYTKKCHKWFEKKLNCEKVLLTGSCTHALEIAAILLNIKNGDEIIMPSYTFVSTANAFVLRGAKIVFVDIRPDTMNLDENKIEQAITDKTKAIVPVHYAGVACDMEKILKISQKYNLYVVEDAAQAMMSKYSNIPLGTIGDLGTFSFHETKNYTSGGEGGLLIINNKNFIERAEIIREKGTNRSLFFRGMVDKYSWVDIGSSYLMNEISAAYLLGNLEKSNDINENRVSNWQTYYVELEKLKKKSVIDLPSIPNKCEHNAHIFYIKVKDLDTRHKLIEHLKSNNVSSAFHYVPLHSSDAAKKFSRLSGEDIYTTVESERLIRLPMFYGLNKVDIIKICKIINDFFS